jgi:hypothetical protein
MIHSDAILHSDETTAVAAFAAKLEQLKADVELPERVLCALACSFWRGRALATLEQSLRALPAFLADAFPSVQSLVYVVEVLNRANYSFDEVLEHAGPLVVQELMLRDSTCGPFLRIGVLLDLFHSALLLLQEPSGCTPARLSACRALLTQCSERYMQVDQIRVVPSRRNGISAQAAGIYIRSDLSSEIGFIRFHCPETLNMIDVSVYGEDSTGSSELEAKTLAKIYISADSSTTDLYGAGLPPIHITLEDAWRARRSGQQPIFPDYDPTFDTDYDQTPLGDESVFDVYERAVGNLPDGFIYEPLSSHPLLSVFQLHLHQAASAGLTNNVKQWQEAKCHMRSVAC